MKRLIPVLVVLMLAVPAFAGMGIGVFGNFSLPLGDFGEGYSIGFGGGAKFCYGFMPTLGVELDAGYLMFSAKDVPGDVSVSFSIIPILVGLNYYFPVVPVKIYVGAGGGMYMRSYSYSNAYDVDESESDFGFFGALGMEYPFSETMCFEANVRFNHILSKDPDEEGSYDSQYIGINAGIIYYFPMEM